MKKFPNESDVLIQFVLFPAFGCMYSTTSCKIKRRFEALKNIRKGNKYGFSSAEVMAVLFQEFSCRVGCSHNLFSFRILEKTRVQS